MNFLTSEISIWTALIVVAIFFALFFRFVKSIVGTEMYVIKTIYLSFPQMKLRVEWTEQLNQKNTPDMELSQKKQVIETLLKSAGYGTKEFDELHFYAMAENSGLGHIFLTEMKRV